MKRLFHTGWMTAVLALAACDGGGGGSDAEPERPGPPPPIAEAKLDCNKAGPSRTSALDALPGGIWQGTLVRCSDSVRLDNAGAWITEDGRFRIFGPDHMLLRGQLGTAGDTFTGGGVEIDYYASGDRFLMTPMVASGSITERLSLDGSWSTEWGNYGVFAFDYVVPHHLRLSSFDDLAGVRLVHEVTGNLAGVWTIATDGRFDGQSDDGCLQSGHFSLVDSRYNLFELEYSVVGCADAGLYSGLATVSNDGLTGERLLDISVDDGEKRAYRILLDL